MQKNGGYNLEHVYSENENAAKCFYLCLQIAHLINQLLENGSLISNAGKKYGSLKNLTRHLLDAIRFITIEYSDIVELFKYPFQIRFNSS
jgi:translation initiation factor 2B subunit (eIF-2B alpha/beta/delta family)